jgi:hypothetical protein
MPERSKILVLGGYGEVGRTVCAAVLTTFEGTGQKDIQSEDNDYHDGDGRSRSIRVQQSGSHRGTKAHNTVKRLDKYAKISLIVQRRFL